MTALDWAIVATAGLACCALGLCGACLWALRPTRQSRPEWRLTRDEIRAKELELLLGRRRL